MDPVSPLPLTTKDEDLHGNLPLRAERGVETESPSVRFTSLQCGHFSAVKPWVCAWVRVAAGRSLDLGKLPGRLTRPRALHWKPVRITDGTTDAWRDLFRPGQFDPEAKKSKRRERFSPRCSAPSPRLSPRDQLTPSQPGRPVIPFLAESTKPHPGASHVNPPSKGRLVERAPKVSKNCARRS